MKNPTCSVSAIVHILVVSFILLRDNPSAFQAEAFAPSLRNRQNRNPPCLSSPSRSSSSAVDTWRSTPTTTTSSLRDSSSRWDQEIEESSRRKATQTGGGAGETAAGAILGGLILGPFGALFGASIGSSVGAKNAMNRARKEEMERMGVTQDMLDMAQEVGAALERSTEGLKASEDSLATQQRLARLLEREASDLYEKAKTLLAASDEEEARRALMKRKQTEEKLKRVLQQCADERKRVETMKSNIKALERRGLEVDSLLRRTVGAKAIQDTSQSFDLSLPSEDPLLQKFRDIGID